MPISVTYQAMMKVRMNGEFLETTPGRVIFNELLPDEVGYVNHTLGGQADPCPDRTDP